MTSPVVKVIMHMHRESAALWRPPDHGHANGGLRVQLQGTLNDSGQEALGHDFTIAGDNPVCSNQSSLATVADSMSTAGCDSIAHVVLHLLQVWTRCYRALPPAVSAVKA